MSDIFKEVDEALRKDKVLAFWEKNSAAVFVGIILLILATAGYSGYFYWQNLQMEKQTAVLIAHTKEGGVLDEIHLSSLSADQQSLAHLNEARRLLNEKKPQEAFTHFEKITKNITVSPDLRGLAAYYARNIILNGDVSAPLTDVSLPVKSIWDGHFKLQNALDLGSKQKKYSDAIVLLDEIIAKNSHSQILLQQAKQLKYVYEFDMKQGQ